MSVPQPERRHSSIYLPVDIHRQLKVYAAQSGRTLTEVIEEAIRRYLEQQKEQP